MGKKLVWFIIIYLIVVFVFSFCLRSMQGWMRGTYTTNLSGDYAVAICVAEMGDSFWCKTEGEVSSSIIPWKVEYWDEKMLYVFETCLLCIRSNIILIVFGYLLCKISDILDMP